MKERLKNFLYSKHFPFSLFAFYFNKKEKKESKRLLEILNNETDLLETVPEIQREHWKLRIQKVMDAPENRNIPRSNMAGSINEGNLIMHNDIKVDPLSYYSFPLLKMLIDNKGVHEPEEEKIFQEVLKSLDPNKKMCMLELGAYWSFYSMWFLSKFPNTDCYMVEPSRKNLYYGKKNFRLNRREGTFIHAGIGNKSNNSQSILCVDDICEKNQIAFLDVLHSDIQGFELEMLQGSKRMLSEGRVGFVFISTHSNELHSDCRKTLLDYNFTEVANVDLDHSSSWDGILVMKAPTYKGIDHVEVETVKVGRS
ncbi:MAG: FkbM family methyltransferase [Flavobacteriales bacterium]|nr:FkbM family methyltransferase [Flavobacteriales bacterium]